MIREASFGLRHNEENDGEIDAQWTSLGVMRPNAKDPTPKTRRGGEVVDEEKFFAERLKIEVRRPEARASLGDVHAPSNEVAHELEGQW